MIRRIVIGLVVVGVLLFALEGGEYGTTDLLAHRSERAALQWQIDSLQREVDSLRAEKKAILTDRTVQERIAREEFGMVRGNELLYRFAEPADSVVRAPED